MLLVFSLLSVASASQECYWNSECPYSLYSSKTPYDTVRGDLRDYQVPNNCEAVSVWTLNRHGNRNPGKSVTVSVKEIADLKDEIINSYNAGNSQLCAQDIEEFKKWTWNETLEVSQSFLTGTGYEELYDIGKRIREKYPHLVEGSSNDFYFRPTNEQRTITSAVAFVHGLTDGTSLNVSIDDVRERDDVIRPYENCDRYQEKVKGGTSLEEHLDAYYKTTEFVAVSIDLCVDQLAEVTVPLFKPTLLACGRSSRGGCTYPCGFIRCPTTSKTSDSPRRLNTSIVRFNAIIT